jgi:hypothetical protein
MKLSEIVSPDTRLFVKSEFGPAGKHWPALSFSSHKVVADFRTVYRPGIDFVIYVGTGTLSRRRCRNIGEDCFPS